jgi:hypothetical protein
MYGPVEPWIIFIPDPHIDTLKAKARNFHSGNKKGRGETAPTFSTSPFTPVPVHPWSKAFKQLRLLRAFAWNAHEQDR